MRAFLDYLSLSNILIVVSIIIMAVALLQRNSNFLDVRSVFISHFKEFRDSPLQFLAIFIVPLLLAIATSNKYLISVTIVNNLNLILTIFMSMFFAMLSILSAFNYKKIDDNKKDDVTANNHVKKYNQLLKQTFNSIMFECIVCILILVIGFCLSLMNDFSFSYPLAIISCIVYYLFLFVLFNIFVVIKRIKKLFDAREI